MPHDRIRTLTGTSLPKATLVDASLPLSKTARAEQIARTGSSLVVTRPRLPAETPVATVPPRDELRRSITPSGGAVRSGAAPSRLAGDTPHFRTAPVLPARPQVTVDDSKPGQALRSEQPASHTAIGRPSTTITRSEPARTEQPASVQHNNGNKPYVLAPRSFSERNGESPASVLPSQHSAPPFAAGKVTPLPSPQPAPGAAGVGNPVAAPLNRPVGAPFVRESSSGIAANQNSYGRSVISSPPAISAPAGRSESPRSFAPPPMRIQPSAPPAIRSEPPRSFSPPPAIRSEPARSFSAAPPAVSAPPPSAPARSYSPAPARSEGGGGGGSRGRGRD